MSAICRTLDDVGADAWNRFVAGHKDGTFFHQAAWSGVIERAFGHRAHYIVAEQDGAITGVLPLVHVRSALFGHTLISSPFCVYGGPLVADRETLTLLSARATDLMGKLGVKAVELRFAAALEPDALDEAEWPTRSDLYVTFRKPIAANDDVNMKAIPRKQRAVVRKGIERGLRSVVGQDVDGLYRIYAESVRNLGTPVFSRRYFKVLAEAFADRMDVVTVLDGENPVAAVMNFHDRDTVLPYYGGGTRAARGCYANDFMYWEVMRRAAANGAGWFDFGRSKVDTGAYAFKKNWGFEPAPLHYRFRLPPGGAIPDVNPLNPKYRMFIAAWKRLPLPVANLVGPHIVRGIG